MKAMLTLAIAGNPNSGKTTMFNALTGARHRVGNYPGVTVERREGRVKNTTVPLIAVDLPGTYSLTAYSAEEIVARDFLLNQRPDAVINVLDAGNLERNLYLAVQLLELGVPVVLALNMIDEVRKKGRTIDVGKLSALLGVPVVATIARSGEGKQELIEQAVARARKGRNQPLCISYGPDLDRALQEMTGLIEKEKFLTDRCPARWTALKYLEQDTHLITLGREASPLGKELEAVVEKTIRHCAATLDSTPESIIADYRYGYIASLLKQGVVSGNDAELRLAFSDRIDLLLTHKILGPIIMLGVFYAMFQLTFKLGEVPMGWLEAAFGWLGDRAAALIPEGHLQSLIVSGIIDGVGGVLGFVPLIMIMFAMITLLEDSGYMARTAYMLDRVLRVFGLHGCSVMPFIVSGGIPGGCAVPGIMATRTLRSPKEKIATLLTTPFMPCGAKVPVFILLTGAFFGESAAAAMFWITMGAWIAALLVAKILRSTVLQGAATPFVMELPPYRLPTLKGICIHTAERVWQYAKKAGTVILAISILLWAAMSFPQLPHERTAYFDRQLAAIGQRPDETSAAAEERQQIENSRAQESLRYSLAGRIGTALESISRLAGFDWKTNIALIGGFAAKEVIVSTLGTASSLGPVDPEDTASLAGRLARDPSWSALKAVCLIVFVLLYAPCFVTVVVLARESSWRWALFSVLFNTLFAFAAAVLIYQIGSRIL